MISHSGKHIKAKPTTMDDKATMIHYFQFTEWIAERYNYIGGELCCWCAKQYDIKDRERYKNTGELWAYWWENCR